MDVIEHPQREQHRDGKDVGPPATGLKMDQRNDEHEPDRKTANHGRRTQMVLASARVVHQFQGRCETDQCTEQDISGEERDRDDRGGNHTYALSLVPAMG